ncbi:hypothetical protein HN992_02410 [Candidatus Woesearchaeota archaeon]|jgi:ribosome-associated translation inhibitor RaiA|nr:hypothetical protein [Candidatus Woesearchaeota archaeon]MBT3439062.1 hypothetical protein [Candidatus Woesearchaeota archaeon]MBT4058603.1 hypothetical protein [Candidatus Woesearchaeota archaeon]MBT4207226.1 hypothetical protein [Candidatus Woesearchaeota archaeon]MBT4731889.1 hypothetical protein [Candidatus Woesearchaeota archaeon]
MSKVNYIGLKSLDATEGEILKTLVLKYLVKLDRSLPNGNVKFHVKLHEIGGKVKYSFHARVKAEKEILGSAADDWDLRRTVHKVMKKLLSSVEHKLKLDGQKQEKFHPKRAKRGFGKSIKMKLKGLVKFR